MLPLLYFSENGSLIPNTDDVRFRLTAGGGGAFSHRLSLACMMMICCALIGTRLPAILAMCRRLRLVLALPALALLSSCWSEKPGQTLVSASTFLIITLFAFYICSRFDANRQLQLIMMVAGVALAASIVVIILSGGSGSSLGWTGIFANKQNCGAVCTLLLVTALNWTPLGVAQRVFSSLTAISCIVLVLMSRSRTGWGLCFAALLLTGAIWFLQRMKRSDALLSAFIVLPPSVGISFLLYYFRSSLLHSGASSLLHVLGKDTTLTERTIIWAAAWQAIGRHPFLGYGYAAFWSGIHGPSLSVILMAGWLLAQAQDGYLDLWLQLGIVGIVVFALLILQAAKNAIVSLHSAEQNSYVRWCIVVIVCTLTFNIGETSLLLPHLVWFLFLVAVVGLSETAHSAKQPPPSRPFAANTSESLDSDFHNVLPLPAR